MFRQIEMGASIILKLCLWLLVVDLVVCSESSCQDIDHHSCLSMIQHNPHMCQDAILSRSVCPQVSKNCPLTCYSCQISSYDVSQCNIITCNKDQSCTLHSSSGNGITFSLGCDTDNVCYRGNQEGITQTGNTTTCCHSDLCNLPTPPTTPAPTVPSYRGPYCYSCSDKSIADAASCQNVTCNKGEKCSVQSLFGSNAYTMSCMTKYYCDRFDEHALYPGTRSTVCCDTDFCNMPQLTTTGVPPVATISHILQQPYPECPRDILIFLDQSEPLVSTWTDVKKFLTDIISTMDIGPNITQTMVSLNRFDGYHHGGWLFQRNNHNKSELLVHIQTLLPYAPRYAPYGNFDIAVVDLHHNPHIYSAEKFGNRMWFNPLGCIWLIVFSMVHIPRCLVSFVWQAVLDVPLFITGSSGRRNDVMLADLRKRYSDIITIGIGNITNTDSVSYIATDKNHSIVLNTTAELLSSAMEHRVLNLICST